MTEVITIQQKAGIASDWLHVIRKMWDSKKKSEIKLTVKSSPLSVRCSVAFNKICPAGKGYFLQNIRETLAFPPIIFPRNPAKEGESLNTVHTNISNISTFSRNTPLSLSLSEPKRPVRHWFFF